ncbi:MAG: 1-deoxy-D-xylulose-5-phosphate synthase [Acidobacteria bacterium]|nr:1-deoxy-D-xylulose-5-phosphate synthase [Acidobacteriota bacterium]
MEHVLDDGVGRARSAPRAGVRPGLASINDPADLRGLEIADLEDLAREIREFLVQVAAEKGGHFAPSLGTVELTLALHHVFHTPEDLVVWDVGHQAYVHKVLTGRRDLLRTIRQDEGISGFLRRTESPYDVFGAGHASTAASAALGMATARDLQQRRNKVIAVVGDGAMTGGLAFEALNNAGASGRDLLVILNDNAMSISPNVGAVAHYLTSLTTHPYYRRMKDEIYSVLRRLPSVGPRVGEFASRLEAGIKGALVPGALFQSLGFHYLGPIDGHDMAELVGVLRKLRELQNGPVLLHVLTQKGKGFALAEADPLTWHGVSPFDRATGRSRPEKAAPPSYTRLFSDALCEVAARDERVVALTAAMASGTGLDRFQERFPDRFFDVGIAEGHGVTFAAGLATQGMRPVCAIYSTFLQRAFDHIIHDVALQDLPVVFALDRAGLVGADGPTHHGAFDLAYLRMVPNMVVSAPRDGDELADLLETAVAWGAGPFAIRYPRGSAPAARSRAPRLLDVGSWEVLREGSWDVTLLAVGAMVPTAAEVAATLAGRGFDPTVVNARFVKPLDLELLRTAGARAGLIVTLEEGTLRGGFGAGVHEASVENGLELSGRLLHRGLPDRFITHGSRGRLVESVGLSPAQIVAAILQRLGRE